MKENKKPVHGGNRERATETAAMTGTTFSLSDYTGSGGNRQGLLALLLTGEDNALTARELAQITGRTDRQITREIERLRLYGCPICAAQNGYYMPGGVDELARYVRAFDRRLRHIRKTREALDDVLIAATGQLPITEVEGV